MQSSTYCFRSIVELLGFNEEKQNNFHVLLKNAVGSIIDATEGSESKHIHILPFFSFIIIITVRFF